MSLTIYVVTDAATHEFLAAFKTSARAEAYIAAHAADGRARTFGPTTCA